MLPLTMYATRLASQQARAAGGTINDIREIPGWCSWMPFSDFADACQPYSHDELENLTRIQAAYVYRNAPDMTPEEKAAKVEEAVQQAEVTEIAFKRIVAEEEGPTGSQCEYEATQLHPTLSKFFGPATVCKVTGGDFSLPLLVGIIGVAVVGGVLLSRSRGR